MQQQYMGYNPRLHEQGIYGVNKKRFFKNNLHHQQQVLLYGSDFERHQQMYDAYGQPIPLTQQQEVLKDP